MCTTAEALKAWEDAVALLDEIKAHAAADSRPPAEDSSKMALLLKELVLCLAGFTTASHSTWETLLQKQVCSWYGE